MSKLETNTIDTVSGTSTLQVGSTNTTTITLGVSGDTINVPSGVTIANSGTATGFGGANTPMFHAYVNSAQSIGTNTDIKITNFNEVIDTASAFASDKFTVPSGQGGKYIIYACVSFASDVTYPHAELYVNGSGSLNSENLVGNMGDTARSCFTSRMLTLSASDYVELYTFQGSGATNTQSSGRTFFGGYKLIE
jgi:hypothetical protein